MVQLEPGDGVEALQLEDVCEQAVEGDLLRQVVVLLILLLHIRIPSTTVLTLTILYSVGKKPWRIFFLKSSSYFAPADSRDKFRRPLNHS